MSTETEALPLATENAPQPPPIAGGKPKSALIAVTENHGIALRTMEDIFLFAKAVLNSSMAPKGFDTPEKILVAIQMGMEVGLSPMSALQNIAVINGKPTIYGDAVPGICQSELADYKDEMLGSEGSDDWGYKVTVSRRGRASAIVRSFTVSDAKKAGLWQKGGPWTLYPKRMLLMRARTFAFRDCFPDLLRGLPTYEESRDTPEMRNVTPASLSDIDAPKS